MASSALIGVLRLLNESKGLYAVYPCTISKMGLNGELYVV